MIGTAAAVAVAAGCAVGSGHPVPDVAGAAAGIAAGVLAAVAARLRADRWSGWVAAGLLTTGLVLLPGLPAWLEVARPAGQLIALVGWAVAALGQLARGAVRRRALPLWLGLGFAVLAAAQLPGVAGAGLLPTGLLMLLAGYGLLVRDAVGALRARLWQLQEELVAAAVHGERVAELAAERDHELRNGVAGLAGITHLLGADGEAHEALRHAVLAELGRLHMILDGVPDEPGADYPVEPVLAGLVLLHRSAGGSGQRRVRLRVQPGLRARGRPAVLAQVVTNLLANCDRHAPGAAVRVEAVAGAGAVVIRVRDEGPGLSGRVAGSALDRGVHDEAAGGSGLGLHICRQLLAREGGTLTLRSVDNPSGCLATVTVPLAAPEQPVSSAARAVAPPPAAEADHAR